MESNLMCQTQLLDADSQIQQETAYYRLAVNYALLGNIDSSYYFLDKFITVAEDDRVALVDKDFDILRQDSLKWQILINKIEKNYLSCINEATNPELALKLFYLGIDDQRYRLYLPSLGQIPMDKDSNGVVRYIIYGPFKEQIEFEKIIKKYGFPTITMVGKSGSSYAFLLLQHSSIIKRYYKKVKKAFKLGDINPLDFALLTDRYLMDCHRKQLYGTQFYQTNRTRRKYPNELILYPVKDFKNVNDRRFKIGFTSTVEEYTESFGSNHIIPQTYYEKK